MSYPWNEAQQRGYWWPCLDAWSADMHQKAHTQHNFASRFRHVYWSTTVLMRSQTCASLWENSRDVCPQRAFIKKIILTSLVHLCVYWDVGVLVCLCIELCPSHATERPSISAPRASVEAPYLHLQSPLLAFKAVLSSSEYMNAHVPFVTYVWRTWEHMYRRIFGNDFLWTCLQFTLF